MRTLLTTLVAIAILAAGVLAQTIDAVTASSESIGATVTITGTGFGTKKPSVFLTSPETGTKKFALKVTFNSDTSVVATISKGIAGSFDLNVKIGATTVTATDAVSLLAPTITGGQAVTADVGTSVTLNGIDFGSKKGKVVAGAKKAKVVSWTDAAITFTVPTSIPNGPVVVDVSNSLGGDSISDYLAVTGSNVPLGTNKVIGSIGGKPFKPKIHFIFFNGNNWTLTMTELGAHARSVAIAIFDLTSVPAIYDGTESTPATLGLSIGGGGGAFSGNPGEFTITITHHEGNKFGGVISGEVTGVGDVKIPIPSVQFIWDTGP